MAALSSTAAFTLCPSPPVRAYQYRILLSSSLYSCYLPSFPSDSPEFLSLRDYYGSEFLSLLLPEEYGRRSNVKKTKGCVQQRVVDLSGRLVTKEFLKAALAYWQDFACRLKRNKSASERSAFQELTTFRSVLHSLPVPGFQCKVDAAIERLRLRQSVLVLIEPYETLLRRNRGDYSDADFGHKGWSYWLRPGARRLISAVRKHPRALVYFYTCLSKQTCKRVCPALSRKVGFFHSRYCGEGKALRNVWESEELRDMRFGRENTVLVESDWQRCGGIAEGVVVVGKCGGEDTGQEMEKLETYLLDLLATSDYDVCDYTSQRPFSP